MNAGILIDTPTAEKQALTNSQLPAIEIRGNKVSNLNRISLFNFSYCTLHLEYFPHATLE